MRELDFDRILVLLNVVEKSMGHPNLNLIQHTAMAELQDICAPEEEPVPVDEPKATPKAEDNGGKRRL